MSCQIIEMINERFLLDDIITDEFIEECNIQLQQELFVLPIHTYEVANLGGWKLYSSDSLKRKFIQVMHKISRTKSVAENIESMIMKQVVVPCWINKGIFRLALFKLFASKGAKSTAGFYTAKENQIYILLDNNISYGFASSIELANILLHESMHMSAKHMGRRFFTLFSSEISSFYTAMIEYIFKTSGNISKEISSLVKFLSTYELSSVRSYQIFTKSYTKLLDNSFRSKTKLNDNEFDEALFKYINFIRLYFRDENSFVRGLRDHVEIYRGMLVGYQKGLRVKNNISLCIQELFFPSEIIAMYAELCSKGKLSKIYKAFRGIRGS